MGSVLRVTSLVATTLVALFLMPFLVHRLGDKSYGYWTLIGAVLGYYGILDLGIGSAVQYQVAKALGDKNPDTANRIISTAFHIFAAVGVFILLSTIATSRSRDVRCVCKVARPDWLVFIWALIASSCACKAAFCASLVAGVDDADCAKVSVGASRATEVINAASTRIRRLYPAPKLSPIQLEKPFEVNHISFHRRFSI